MKKLFSGKKILVTGGTGSFGHQIVNRLMKEDPDEIRIISRDEKKQYDMQFEFQGNRKLRFIIGDVRSKESLLKAMRGVDIVFHAAALKQVPSCEYNPYEAVKTNAMGAQNVIDAALFHNVEKVIAISTDKAAEPVNVMGMTKAIQERLITSANVHRDGKRTVFSCVRYGNVLGSRGSVIPVLRNQIDNDQDLTITDYNMTRFILTLDNAIDLVFKSVEYSLGGEIFILKIPAHTVVDLAEVMLEASGKKLKLTETGIRPGEKIHETLVTPTESIRTIEKENLFIILPQVEIPEVEKKYKNYKNENLFRFSSDTAEKLNKAELKEMLKNEKWI
ncbi:MAG: polysaccharide biosynthesis protein [Ignavibacteria bacterium]|nr:polysaccharide biosynthesis protein [Ignavibacteria bacterium]